jgi:hypothetical protein
MSAFAWMSRQCQLIAGYFNRKEEVVMYVVFGKSIQKEEQRKGDIANKLSPSDRYYSNKNAYQISPDYYSLARCHEFIELAKKNAWHKMHIYCTGGESYCKWKKS